jgi:hypothetical protein
MLSRGLIDDLKRQHFDTPEEVFDMETFRQSRQAAKEREKIRYLNVVRNLFIIAFQPQPCSIFELDSKKITSCVCQRLKKTNKIAGSVALP